MIRHRLTAVEGVPVEGGWVMRSNCLCGLLLTGRAKSVRRARRNLKRRAQDHRGFAMAAGPGGLE
jgi:hypothetical protein